MSNRARALKISGALALAGPLPGYAVFAYRNFLGEGTFRETLRLFFYFYGAALLMFGWYCFLIGLAGVFLHDKLGALGLPRPVRAGAMILLGAASAVPTILLEGSATKGLGVAGIVSAGFWIAAYLMLTVRGGAPLNFRAP